MSWLLLWVFFLKLSSRSNPGSTTQKQPVSFDTTPLRVISKTPTVWALALVQELSADSLYFTLSWLPSYLQNVKHLDVLHAGVAGSIPYIGAIVFSVFLTSVTDRSFFGGTAANTRRLMIGPMTLLASTVATAPLCEGLHAFIGLFTVAMTGTAAAGSMNHTLWSTI
jgi:sugar phosphate permease